MMDMMITMMIDMIDLIHRKEEEEEEEEEVEGEEEEEVVIVAEEGEEVEVDLAVVLNKDMMIEDMAKDEEGDIEEEEDQDQDMIQIIKRIYIVIRWKPNDFLQRNN